MAENQPNKTIYIRNIPYSATGQELAEAFQEFGKISQSRIISAFIRGKLQSRGFGFIDFELEEGCRNALNHEQPIKINERTLFVSEARPKVHHPRDTIFLRDIAEGTEENDIKEAFKDYNVKSVRIPKPRNASQTRKYYAFVTFDSEESCKKVIDLKKVVIKGKEINVLYAHPKVRFPPFRRGGRRGGYRGRGRRGGYRGRGRRGGYRGRGRGRRAIRKPATQEGQNSTPAADQQKEQNDNQQTNN